jgi:3-methyladenine DNA glycosylase AlkD
VTAPEILQRLQSLSNPENVAGMARFGIHATTVYGVSLPHLKKLARQLGKDHLLAEELWSSGAHEARLLACFMEDPAKITRRQMDRWAGDFDNWAVCDGCCLHLFAKVPLAQEKAVAWCVRSREFVKRAGFVLMAILAVHDKKASDSLFREWLRLIKDASTDERNFVRKAVNWALRQIGKRNLRLRFERLRLFRSWIQPQPAGLLPTRSEN